MSIVSWIKLTIKEAARVARWALALVIIMVYGTICATCGTGYAAPGSDPAPAEGEFWGMSALHALPFDIQVLSSEVKDGIRNDEIFYTSEHGKDGQPVRVYAYLAGPVEPQGKIPVILMIHGGGGTADKGAAPWMAKLMGAYVLSFDWMGPFADRKIYSRFDAALDPKVASAPTWVAPDCSDASLRHIGRAGLRGIDLLLAQKSADPARVLVMGGSWGGFLSLLTNGIDPRVTTSSAAFGAGGFAETDGLIARDLNKKEVSAAQRDTWYTHFDPIRFAGNIKKPVQLLTGTNDRFFWLGSDAAMFKALPPGSVLAISPNTDHTLGAGIDSGWTHWFKTQLGMEPAWPTLEGFQFDGQQASWKASGPSPVTQGLLVFSPGRDEWPTRCWLEFPAQGPGAEFSVRLPEWAQGVEGDGYALITDQLGRVITSVPLHVTGKSPLEFSKGRPEPGLLDDFSDGVDRWRPAMYAPGQAVTWRKPAAGQPGALEITRQDGLAGELSLDTNTIRLAASRLGPQGALTFKADLAGAAEKLKIELVEHGKMFDEKVFPVEITLPAAPGWQPVELALSRFVLDGQPPDWSKVDELRLTFRAADKTHYALSDFRIK